MGQPVLHFEVMGKDGDKLKDFYGAMFGWEFNKVSDEFDYGTVDREKNLGPGGEGIGGGIGSTPEGAPGHLTFYVHSPDVEASLKQAEELGGKRVMGPDKIMDSMEIGLFTDPDGNTVGLVNPNLSE